jgi:hypothetical protein
MDAWIRAAVGRRGLGLAALGLWPWMGLVLPLDVLLLVGAGLAAGWLALLRADAEEAREQREADEIRELMEVAEWNGMKNRFKAQKGGRHERNGA